MPTIIERLQASLAGAVLVMVYNGTMAHAVGGHSECSKPDYLEFIFERDPHALVWYGNHPANVIVVCIPGMTLPAQTYSGLATHLQEYNIDGIALNVSGFCAIGPCPDQSGLDLERTCKKAEAVLQELRGRFPGRRICLIGESLGAVIAIKVAAQNPHLVDGLVCSASACKLNKRRRTTAKGIAERLLRGSGELRWTTQGLIRQITSNPQFREKLANGAKHRNRMSMREGMTVLRFISNTGQFARQLRVPVLAIHGLQDRLISPVAAAKLVRVMPGSRVQFAVLGSAEHMLLQESQCSSDLTRLLAGWLREEAQTQRFAALQDQNLNAKQRRLLLKLERLSGNDYERIVL